MKKIGFAFLASVLFSSPLFAQPLQTVPFVDVSQYLGRWYQIARNPLPFEDGCVCAQQTLTLLQNGHVGVYNSCNDRQINGPLREIRGYAVNNDPQTNAQFTVYFDGVPVAGQYWIIGLDPQYRFAIVSDPSRRSLYILSKTPLMEPELLTKALELAARQSDTSRLEFPQQQGCLYPQRAW